MLFEQNYANKFQLLDEILIKKIKLEKVDNSKNRPIKI